MELDWEGVVLAPCVMWILLADYGIIPSFFVEGAISLLLVAFLIEEYRIRDCKSVLVQRGQSATRRIRVTGGRKPDRIEGLVIAFLFFAR